MPTWKKSASVLLVMAAPALAQTPCPAEQAHDVRVGQQSFQVEVAADDASRARGLSGHAPLARTAGMWFVLDRPDQPGFWMRGMNFPIDLLWVSPDKRVAGVEHLQPCQTDPCPVSYPPVEVRYVLEVGAGRYSGSIGDPVSWTCQPGRRSVPPAR